MFRLNSVRKLIVPLCVATSFLVSAPSVWASNPTSASTTHTRTTRQVDWTIVPGPAGSGCPLISVTLVGSGTGVDENTTAKLPNGSQIIIDNDVVRGTVKASNGAVYRFDYKNTTIQNIPMSGPTQIFMTDDFKVTNREDDGGAILHSAFVWSWSTTGAIWPPSDNWHQFRTLGDSFNCDPI